jgi:DNA-binding ferritin-like protein (Dps family)
VSDDWDSFSRVIEQPNADDWDSFSRVVDAPKAKPAEPYYWLLPQGPAYKVKNDDGSEFFQGNDFGVPVRDAPNARPVYEKPERAMAPTDRPMQTVSPNDDQLYTLGEIYSRNIEHGRQDTLSNAAARQYIARGGTDADRAAMRVKRDRLANERFARPLFADESWDSFRSDRIPENLAAFLGQMAGSSMSPEAFAGGVQKTIAGAMAVNAAINAAADATVQTSDINIGEQDKFDLARLAISAGFGSALGGIFKALEKAPGGYSKVMDWLRANRKPDPARVAEDIAAEAPGQTTVEIDGKKASAEAAPPSKPLTVEGYIKRLADDDIGVEGGIPDEPVVELPETRPPQGPNPPTPRAEPVVEADEIAALDAISRPVEPPARPRPPLDLSRWTPETEKIDELDAISEIVEPEGVTAAQPPKVSSDPDRNLASRAGVEFFNAKDLEVDAPRFQFKGGGDEFGVSERLRGVKKWDPKMAGQIMAWEDASGRRFVVDGHQRVGLAKRIMAQEDGQDDIVLAGQLLREADGITAEDAMAIAAKKNMAEGTGTPTDAAKVLRLRPDMLNDPSMPFNGRNMRIAQGLVPLGPEAFGMVVNDVVPEEMAAVVGRLIPDDKPMQVSAMGLLAKLEPSNATEAESIVRQALDAGAEREVQTGLFGDEVVANSYFGERAKVLNKALQKLGRDRRVFATLVNEADVIQGAGNKLDTGQNQKIADAASTARAVLIKAANRKGPLSDALTAAAKRARDTGRFEGPVNEFAAEVRRTVESGQLDGDPVGANVGRRQGGLSETEFQWSGFRHPVTGESIDQALQRSQDRPPTAGIRTPERDNLRVSIAQELYGAGGKPSVEGSRRQNRRPDDQGDQVDERLTEEGRLARETADPMSPYNTGFDPRYLDALAAQKLPASKQGPLPGGPNPKTGLDVFQWAAAKLQRVRDQLDKDGLDFNDVEELAGDLPTIDKSLIVPAKRSEMLQAARQVRMVQNAVRSRGLDYRDVTDHAFLAPEPKPVTGPLLSAQKPRTPDMFADAPARRETERKGKQPDMFADETAGGKQTVLPGAERIGQGEQAQRAMDARKLAKKPQKDVDELPLFGEKGKQETLFQIGRLTGDTDAPFYSAVERTITEAPNKRARGSQWLGMLRNKTGVKPEEIKETGLGEFLEANANEMVEKADLLNRFKANEVELTETRLGGDRPALSRTEIEAKAREKFDQDTSDVDGDNAFHEYLYDEAKERARDRDIEDEYRVSEMFSDEEIAYFREELWSDVKDDYFDATESAAVRQRSFNDPAPTKFSQHTLPGGENYREVLLQLPEGKGGKFDPAKVKIERKRQSTTQGSVILYYGGKEIGSFDDPPMFNPQTKNYETRPDDYWIGVVQRRYGGDPNLGIKPMDEGVSYRSGHWLQPNVVAHLRMSDRQSPGGGQMLHIEEVQSDWHQEGRKKGYRDKGSEQTEAFEAKLDAIRDKQSAVRQARLERQDEIILEVSDGRARTKRELMDIGDQALFKKYDKSNNTDERLNWLRAQEQALDGEMLRAREARDAQQNLVPDAPFKKTWHELAMKRALREAAEGGYDEIAWTPGEVQADRYDLSKQVDSVRVWAGDSGKYYLEVKKDGRDLGLDGGKQYTPDDLSNTIGKDLTKKAIDDVAAGRDAKYSGVDLRVGGEGMKGFYDNILVDWANKWAKKYGQKVGRTQIEVPNKDGQPWSVYDSNNRLIAQVAKEADAKQYATNFKGRYERTPETETKTLHSLKITPEMRADLMGGQPLFQRSKVRTPFAGEFKTKKGVRAVPLPHYGHGSAMVLRDMTEADWKSHDALIKSIDAEIQKISPKTKVEWLKSVEMHRYDDARATIDGLSTTNKEGPAIYNIITMALDRNDLSPPHIVTARHETLHALRHMGYLTKDEWSTLSKAAEDFDWLNKYEINERYPGAKNDLKIEEAVAEAFGHWRQNRSRLAAFPAPVRQAFRKIDNFLRRMAAAVRRVLGRDATAQDVFALIDSGVVGRRKVKNVVRAPDLASPDTGIAAAAQKAKATQREKLAAKLRDAEAKLADMPTFQRAFDQHMEARPSGENRNAWAAKFEPPEGYKAHQAAKAEIRDLKSSIEAIDRSETKRAEMAPLKRANEEYAVELADAHKRKEMTFKAMKVSNFNNLPHVKLHKSPNFNGRQSSEYRLIMVDGRPAYARKSNHWGKFGTNVRTVDDAVKEFGVTRDEAQEWADRDPFGRMGKRSYNWRLEGGDEAARTSQAGYVFLDDMKEAPDGAPKLSVQSPQGPVTTTPSPERTQFYWQTRLGRLSDWWRVKLQDKVLPLRRRQELLEAARGEALSPGTDAYLAEELYHGRSGSRIEAFQQDVVQPLIEKMGRLKLSADQVHEYLYARHAPERNAAMARLQNNPEDGPDLLGRRPAGSGMTDDEAAAIMSRFERDGLLPALQDVARDFDDIQAGTRQILQRGDLITDDMRQAWEGAYQHYVPLRGFEDSPDPAGLDTAERMRVGRGFDIRGQESKRALGRRSRAGDILAHILAGHEEAIIRAEKNRVSQTFLRMVMENPDRNLWEIDKVPLVRTIDNETGRIAYRPDQRHKLADNVMGVKVGGNVHYITIHDPALAAAMKNLNADDMNIVFRSLSRVNRVMSKMITQWNPAFTIPNFARDIQGALITAKALNPRVSIREVVRDIPSAMRGAFEGSRGRRDSEWTRWYQEFSQNGGKISFFGMDDIETRARDIRSAINRTQPTGANAVLKAVNGVGQLFSDANGAVENATRLSVYVSLRRAGVDPKKAASVARNVTVNFNRKGEWSPYLNASFMFFNASVQGSMTMMRALKAMGPKVAGAVIGSGIALGFMQDQLNNAISPIDDDGENRWDKLSDFAKDHNWILMNPESGSDITAFKVPAPYGWNVLPAIGRRMSELARGKEGTSPIKAAGGILGVMMNSFNPIGGEVDMTDTSDMIRSFAPTLAKPIAEVAVNENFAGNPIQRDRESFGREIPESERGFKTTSPILKEVTAWLNEVTGGSRVRPGAVDISPAVIEHFINFAIGGVGQTITKTFQLPGRLMDEDGGGENPRTWPVIGRFLEGVNESYTGRRYFALKQAIDLTRDELRAAMNDRDTALTKRTREDYAPEIKVMGQFKAIDAALKKLTERRNGLASRMDIADEVKDERIRALDEHIRKLQTRAVRAYNDALKEHRGK